VDFDLRLEIDLQRLAGRTDKIAQNGNVGTVRADAPGVHGKSETLREIEIHARVIQFRQTESLRGQHTIDARRIHRAGRTVTPPRAPRQLVKLLPIAFVPSRHFFASRQIVHDIWCYVCLDPLDARAAD
jgi:hypothetical protein